MKDAFIFSDSYYLSLYVLSIQFYYFLTQLTNWFFSRFHLTTYLICCFISFFWFNFSHIFSHLSIFFKLTMIQWLIWMIDFSEIYFTFKVYLGCQLLLPVASHSSGEEYWMCVRIAHGKGLRHESVLVSWSLGRSGLIWVLAWMSPSPQNAKKCLRLSCHYKPLERSIFGVTSVSKLKSKHPGTLKMLGRLWILPVL
jgi:hypothetical protein